MGPQIAICRIQYIPPKCVNSTSKQHCRPGTCTCVLYSFWFSLTNNTIRSNILMMRPAGWYYHLVQIDTELPPTIALYTMREKGKTLFFCLRFFIESFLLLKVSPRFLLLKVVYYWKSARGSFYWKLARVFYCWKSARGFCY